MSRDDWFRRKTWTHEDEEQFLVRLARSRSVGNKSQYAKIQGMTLREHGLIEPAIVLLNRVIDEWPERLELASAHLELAKCYGDLNQSDRAIHHYRESLAAEEAFPNMQTQAWLMFPWFILSHELTQHFEEAEKVILDREGTRSRDLPLAIYRWAGAKALFSDHRGDRTSAKHFATIAWDASQMSHSGYRYHPDIGLVRNLDNNIHNQIAKLAGHQVALFSRVLGWWRG